LTSIKPNEEIMEKNLPELIPVISSQIEAIGFDSEDEAMFIRFPPAPGKTEGSLYRYDDVPAEVFAEFQASASKGSYFYRNIKTARNEAGMLRYPYTKLPASEPKSESGGAPTTDQDVPY
jgi:hypothetical protein